VLMAVTALTTVTAVMLLEWWEWPGAILVAYAFYVIISCHIVNWWKRRRR